MNRLKLLCACICLTGCAAPAPNTSAAPRPEILWIGDSLSEQFATPGKRSSDILQTRLGSAWAVVNAAMGGTTTQDWLTKLPPLLESRPALVLVELGVNDGPVGGLSLAQTHVNMLTIFVMIRAAGGFPIFLAADWEQPALEREYIQACADAGVPILRDYEAGVFHQPDFTTADLRHPNEAGAVILESNLWPLLHLYLP